MTTRRTVLTIAAIAALVPGATVAQSAPRTYRIGYLSNGGPASPTRITLDDFRAGMRELGYQEGTDFAVEWRYADGRSQRFPALAGELVRMKVDVIVVAGGTAAIRAAQRATATIPIVMASNVDPVEKGFVANLARPGGNITGLSSVVVDLAPKQMELLIATVPHLATVAILMNPDNAAHPGVARSAEASAQSLKINVLRIQARDLAAVEKVFGSMASHRVGAVVIPQDPLFNAQFQRIAELALKNRLPSVAASEEYARAGGLMCYKPGYFEGFRRSATYVDKILKGAKPADLPIEQPTKFELVVNVKTAKALGITIPQSIRQRAHKVIE